MTEVSETELPGVGVRHDFTTAGGDRLGVLAHRTGRRELLVYDERDPDACRVSVNLEPDDSQTLAELLGGGQVSESVRRLQQVEALAIDWLTISPSDAAHARQISEAAPRRETAVLIVAVSRVGDTVLTPGPDFELRAGDTVLAVGAPADIRQTFRRLQRG